MQDETRELLDSSILGLSSGQIPLAWPSEFAAAVLSVCRQARQDIRIYSRDLDATLYDHPELVELLQQIALSRRGLCIRILIEDSSQLRKRQHRLIPLIRRLPSRLALHRPPDELLGSHRSFLLADHTAIVYRSHPKEYRGYVDFNHRRLVREINEEFMEVWQQSEVERSLRQLSI